MRLITQCPACATMFKVVPDQLRISDGWVRCGQCHEVFDAHLHLQPLEAVLAPSEPSRVPATASAKPLPTERPSSVAASLLATTATADLAAQDAAAFPQEPVLHWESAPSVALNAVVEPALEPQAARSIDNTPSPSSEPEPLPQPAAEPLPSFMTGSPGMFQRRSNGAQWPQVLGATVLSLGLLLQGLFQERDRLSAAAPLLKPWLQDACSWLGCTVEPFRRIETVLIDSSSFTRVRGDVYRLAFTIKNAGTVPIAVPALELTLTDLSEQVMLRRALQASELGQTEAELAPGAEWSAQVPVSVRLAPTSAPIAGYRLLAFYP